MYKPTKEELDLALLYPRRKGNSSANNYAYSLDGVDEHINNDGVITDVSTDTQIMLGMTVNIPDITASSVACFWSVSNAASPLNRILLYTLTDGKLYAQCVRAGSTRWIVSTTSAVLVNNTTVFIGLDHNGTEAKLYVDGSAPAQSFSNSTDKADFINDLTAKDKCTIGAGNDSGAGYKFFTGATFDEFFWYRSTGSAAEWTEAYNGGAFLDFTTHSKGTPYQWLQMGDNGTFSTNWTETDQGTGGNDATTANMEEGDRVSGLI